MKFRYELPESLRQKAASLKEFANGGAQVTVRLSDGRVFQEVLLSNGTAIVAVRGYTDLPFAVSAIRDIYQTAEDENPSLRGGWRYLDSWQ